MAGGTWVDQNKVRPGVYINYKSAPSSLATMGERGVVAIARVLDWGERGKWYTITDPSDCEQFGHSITDAECLFIRQILLGTNRTQGASKILLWSLETPDEGGTQASLSFKNNNAQNVVVKALNPGREGNQLSLEIEVDDGDATWKVYNGDLQVASQTINNLSDLNESMSEYIETVPTTGSALPEGSEFHKTNLSGGLDGGNAAVAFIPKSTTGMVQVTAAHPGAYGNRLSVVITSNGGGQFIVQTLLDGQTVDSQIASKFGELRPNEYVARWGFTSDSQTGIAETSGVNFEGGSNGDASLQDYSDFLDHLELENFNVVIYDGTDTTTKDAYIDFVKRLSNREGIKCQAVISNATPNPDNECVINCYPHSLTLSDGSVLAPSEMTWWVGGAQAGANVNESLTYVTHPNAVDFSPKLNSAAQETAITSGQFALISNKGNVQVLTDINSFRTYAVEKGKAFSKNRVVRTVFGLCNDIYDTFSQYYIGAVSNDEEGRKALKGEILSLMNRYQGIRALQNVEADDVTVLKGVDSDAVVIEIYCQPVDSIEKIYVNITIS
jgi:hypothetical protein